jgi:hypothetical protein
MATFVWPAFHQAITVDSVFYLELGCPVFRFFCRTRWPRPGQSTRKSALGVNCVRQTIRRPTTMPDTANADAPKFDFITEASFRASLESDYRELTRCLKNGAWKAVHVLAGSVVEAVLTDHLVGIDYQKKSGKDPFKMELGPIITACRDEKIITERTADLSSVIRSYRNLIHPGRIARLKEKVDAKTASIAKALVDVVTDEVSAAKAVTYGFTAEQIANKIEKDSSAIALLTHLLEETKDHERERLVSEVLPNRFFFRVRDEGRSGHRRLWKMSSAGV